MPVILSQSSRQRHELFVNLVYKKRKATNVHICEAETGKKIMFVMKKSVPKKKKDILSK